MARQDALHACAFPTELGWMALVAGDTNVKQITAAHPSAAAALSALDRTALELATDDCQSWQWLVRRLQDFAAGRPIDFTDVPLALAGLTPFRRRVVRYCRAIPYGHTLSYGELAARAGSPRAARAVGSTMATNHFAVVVPCHRVINADGTPGRYGAPDGTRTKYRLLGIERRGLAAYGKPAKLKIPRRLATSR